MDASDVSLAIRRARRSRATVLDLSSRHLTTWPEEAFGLSSVLSLNLSDNSLASFDTGVFRLCSLETLDLSRNKLTALPQIEMSDLPRLKSLLLEGNPCAMGLPSAALRQLTCPTPSMGHTPAEKICTVLTHCRSGTFESLGPDPGSLTLPVSAPSPPTAGRPATSITGRPAQDDSDDDYVPVQPVRRPTHELGRAERHAPAAAAQEVMAFTAPEDDSDDDYVPLQPVRQPTHELGRAERHAPAAAAQAPSFPSGSGAASEERLQKEVVQLKARIAELEKPGSSDAKEADMPAWLRGVDSRAGMSKTLPSRRSGMMAEDENEELRNKLEEERRKCKRLEQSMQRLSQRHAEQATVGGGGADSAPSFDMSEVVVGDQLGQGGFSVVQRAVWHGTPVVLKKLFDPKVDEDLLAEFDNEAVLLHAMRHPNILSLLAVIRKPPQLAMMTELMEGGSLYEALHKPGHLRGNAVVIAELASAGEDESGSSGSKLPIRLGIRILIESAQALAFLHGRGVVHRDIKSQNILLTIDLRVRLCDFGLARWKSELNSGRMQFAGTPPYMAPELFRQERHGMPVDVYAFGIMIWETVTQERPFANLDVPEVRSQVLQGRRPPLPPAASLEVSAVLPLAEACWVGEQSARLPMSDVLQRLLSPNTPAARTGRPRPRREGIGAGF